MKELHSYLKQATRGLPRIQKEDLWSELETDILERVSQLRSFGLSEQEALRKTLKQFGASQSIQQGMHQIYLLPKITRWAVGMLCTGMMLVSASSVPEISIIEQPPVPYCKTGKLSPPQCGAQKGFIDNSWLEVGELRKQLAAAGVNSEIKNHTLHLQFPERTIKISLTSSFTFPSPVTVFEQQGKTYLNIARLLDILIWKLQTPVVLKGVNNPVLTIGNVQLRLNNHHSQAIWASRISLKLMNAHGLKSIKIGAIVQPITTFRLSAQARAGVAYALVFPSSSGSLDVAVGEGQKDGTILFNTDIERRKHLYAVDDFKKLRFYPNRQRYSALLLEASGPFNGQGLSLKTVSPSQIQFE